MMSVMFEKFSLKPVVIAHHQTLVDARNDGRRPIDFVAQYAPAVSVGLILGVLEVLSPKTLNLGSVTSSLLTTTGLLAAFLFGLAVTLLEKAIDLEAQVGDSDGRQRLREIAANTAYAAAVAAITTLVLLVGEISGTELITVVGLAGTVLLFTVGAMVLRRVFSETRTRLDTHV